MGSSFTTLCLVGGWATLCQEGAKLRDSTWARDTFPPSTPQGKFPGLKETPSRQTRCRRDNTSPERNRGGVPAFDRRESGKYSTPGLGNTNRLDLLPKYNIPGARLSVY
uniref:Uncharacterized protein n=1 Tax=Timema cristinae TaxID=61476 RepID=A0A7R9GY03_TIMCR|nr:unnamed protein product [Timema cristinae]